MGVRVKSDFSGAAKKIKQKKERTQLALDQQILKDSNFYLPFQDGVMMNSSFYASDLGKGLIAWDTPYARRLYWNPSFNFSKDRNPNARALWFEHAKSIHLDDWLAIAKVEVNK